MLGGLLSSVRPAQSGRAAPAGAGPQPDRGGAEDDGGGERDDRQDEVAALARGEKFCECLHVIPTRQPPDRVDNSPRKGARAVPVWIPSVRCGHEIGEEAVSATLVTAPAAGWYPDPSDSGSWRWWDGGTWTSHVRPKEQTAPVASSQPGRAAADPGPRPVVGAAARQSRSPLSPIQPIQPVSLTPETPAVRAGVLALAPPPRSSRSPAARRPRTASASAVGPGRHGRTPAHRGVTSARRRPPASGCSPSCRSSPACSPPWWASSFRVWSRPGSLISTRPAPARRSTRWSSATSWS